MSAVVVERVVARFVAGARCTSDGFLPMLRVDHETSHVISVCVFELPVLCRFYEYHMNGVFGKSGAFFPRTVGLCALEGTEDFYLYAGGSERDFSWWSHADSYLTVWAETGEDSVFSLSEAMVQRLVGWPTRLHAELMRSLISAGPTAETVPAVGVLANRDDLERLVDRRALIIAADDSIGLVDVAEARREFRRLFDERVASPIEAREIAHLASRLEHELATLGFHKRVARALTNAVASASLSPVVRISANDEVACIVERLVGAFSTTLRVVRHAHLLTLEETRSAFRGDARLLLFGSAELSAARVSPFTVDAASAPLCVVPNDVLVVGNDAPAVSISSASANAQRRRVIVCEKSLAGVDVSPSLSVVYVSSDPQGYQKFNRSFSRPRKARLAAVYTRRDDGRAFRVLEMKESKIRTSDGREVEADEFWMRSRPLTASYVEKLPVDVGIDVVVYVASNETTDVHVRRCFEACRVALVCCGLRRETVEFIFAS